MKHFELRLTKQLLLSGIFILVCIFFSFFFLLIALSTTFLTNIKAADTVFSDGFSGGSIGEDWNTSQGTWVQSDGVLTLTGYASGDYNKAVITGITANLDYTMTVKLRVNSWSNGDNARVGITLNADTANSNRGYSLLFHNDHNTVQWFWDGAGWGPAYTFSWSNETWYWFKVEELNGAFYGKVWADGTSEPSGWMYFWNEPDGGLNGYPALVGGVNEYAAASFDDVTVTTSDPMPSPTPPPNDDFANAQTIALDSIIPSQIEPLANSTTEEDEPITMINDKFETIHTIWYKWTATTTNEVYFDTCDMHIDSVDPYRYASVFTGVSVDVLTRVADNWMYCYKGARVFFIPSLGTTYYFQVSLNRGDDSIDSGRQIWYQNYGLMTASTHDPDPAKPVNDDFDDATVIQNNLLDPNSLDHAPYNVVDSSDDSTGFRAATRETGEPGINNTANLALNSVWWKWTNNEVAKTMWIHTCGTQNPDSAIDVYTGTQVDELSWVAGNDDYWTDPVGSGAANWECNWEWYTSFATFSAEANTTYYIREVDLSNGSGSYPLYFYTEPIIYEPVSSPLTAPYYYCSNSAGDGRTIDYGMVDGGLSEDSWAQCEAWCEASMSQDFSQCQFNQDATRACWLSKSPFGGMDNCSWTLSSASNPRTTYVGQTNGYTLIPGEGLKATLKSNLDMDVSEFKQIGERALYVMQSSSSDILADTTVEFDSNLDWTGTVTGAADVGTAKSYIHNLLTADGVVDPSFDLYVPIPDGTASNQVVICPGAESLNDVSPTCSGGITKNLGDPGVDQVQIDGHWYWIISGVTGTGGQSLLGSFTLKDTMTREMILTASNHDILFGTTLGLSAPENTITLTFNGDWNFGTLAVGNIQLLDDGLPVDLGSDSIDSVWGVTFDGNSIIFETPSEGDGYIDVNSVIEIKINNDKIINPSTSGTYRIDIALANTGAGEEGSIAVPIVDSDQVTITGFVNAFLSFDLDTTTLDSGGTYYPNCDADSCLPYEGASLPASNYTVDLGELMMTQVNISGFSSSHIGGLGKINSIYFDLSTNSPSGAVVTYRSLNGELRGPGHNEDPDFDLDIPSTNGSTPIEEGTSAYGIQMINAPTYSAKGDGEPVVNCGETYAKFCVMTLTASSIYTVTSPIADARGKIDVAAAIDGTVVPGNYADEITFIATATF